MKNLRLFFLLGALIKSSIISGQIPQIEGTPAQVDFSVHLREWDGFGFNYVQTAHTYNYDEYPQEYGGFSLLDENEKQEIINLVFGEDGLKVSLLKMFLDPLHQEEPDGEFDHELTTKFMVEFAKKGLSKTQEREDDLTIITTLYGPPGWATLQKFDHGRDLDPDMNEELANYMIDWVRYLKKEKGLPVKYLSLHNEGEDWSRWQWNGESPGMFDYNAYWRPEDINNFIKFMPAMLKNAGLDDVKVTNGEPSNWYRFNSWGCAINIFNDKEALNNLGLITSHGFYTELDAPRWYGNHNSVGIDLLRTERPDLHAWVTSTAWGNMDALFIREIYGNIYQTKVNAIIPWAGIQRPAHWEGGDPNPGCAIKVKEDGSYSIEKGYYFYKQVSRAGQPGMAVAQTYSMETQVPIIAFSSNGTENPNAMIVTNWDKNWNKKVVINIKGTTSTKFMGFRTDNNDENYENIGVFEVKDGILFYEAPIESVTTFYAID